MDIELFNAKREFHYDQEEKFFMRFMKIIFFLCLAIFIWNTANHAIEINLQKNGTCVTGEITIYPGGGRVSYVAENGTRYQNDISGMFLPEHDGTLPVYYLDNPASGMPLTSVSFFLIVYAISLIGIAFSVWQMKRMKASMRKNDVVVREEY